MNKGILAAAYSEQGHSLKSQTLPSQLSRTVVDPSRSRWNSREHTPNTEKGMAVDFQRAQHANTHRVPDLAELKRPEGLGEL